MKILSLAVCLLTFSLITSAQKIHVNIYGGISNYQGDLQSKRYTFKQGHAGFGLGLSYELSDKFMLRGALTTMKVSAHDKFGRNADRNLNFTSGILEAHTALEYHLRNPYEHAIVPYVFAGIAAYHFNPYTHDSTGKKHFLTTLNTEGQGVVQGRSPYKVNQFSLPFGGGIKLSMSDNFRLGLEVGLRKTFTDYLDDVSTTYVDEAILLAARGQKAVELAYRGDEIKAGALYPSGAMRGGAKAKDWYYFTALSASFRFGGIGGGGGRSDKGVGCPTGVF